MASAVLEAIQFRTWGFIKSVVVGSDIRPIAWEALLFDGEASSTGGHVALDVIAGCAMASESVDKLLLATRHNNDELDHMDAVLHLMV